MQDRQDRLSILGIIVLLVLSTIGIVGHDLWTPDEPRVASVGRQVAEGAWIVPTLNGTPFLEQPPLHAWCVALTYRVLGLDPPEIARVVSAGFGIGGIVLVYFLAARLARAVGHAGSAQQVGVLACMSLGLSFEYFSTSHRVVVDGALTFFTTASTLALLYGVTATSRAARGSCIILGFLLASMAFLAKGLIGLAAPAVAFLAMVTVFRGPGLLLWGLAAPACFAIVAGPWLWHLHAATGWEGIRELFVENTIGRVVALEETRSHARPIYYYFVHLPVGLFPAILFVAGAALRRLRGRGVLEAGERRALDLCFLWLGAGFVLLSLAATKRSIYLLPFYPAAAVAGGFWLRAYLEGSEGGAESGSASPGGPREAGDRGTYARALGYVLGGILLVLAASLPCASIFLEKLPIAGLSAGAAATAAAGAFVIHACRRDRRESVLAGTLCGILAAVATAVIFLVPAVDALKSLGPASRRVASLVPPDRAIHALRPDETTEGMIPYYTGRPLHAIRDEDELRRRLDAEPELYLLDVGKRRLDDGSPRWDSLRFPALESLSRSVLFEEGAGSPGARAFRLLLLRREAPQEETSSSSLEPTAGEPPTVAPPAAGEGDPKDR